MLSVGGGWERRGCAEIPSYEKCAQLRGCNIILQPWVVFFSKWSTEVFSTKLLQILFVRWRQKEREKMGEKREREKKED